MKRIIISYITCLLLLLVTTSSVMAHAGHEIEGEGKVVEGIEGSLKITPALSMIDFYLYDVKTNKALTNAKVMAIITMPDGKKIEKELTGMNKEEMFSFMNTVDFTLKGTYIFDITARVQYKTGFKSYHSVKTVTFPFTYEVK